MTDHESQADSFAICYGRSFEFAELFEQLIDVFTCNADPVIDNMNRKHLNFDVISYKKFYSAIFCEFESVLHQVY